MSLKLDESTLNEWVANEVEESETLEFKSALPGRDDRGKHEFLKDVAAMANVNGGTIVYGISDEDGTAGALVPITSASADAEILRLGQSLDASIEPRLSGVKFSAVPITAGGFVLAVCVERSFSGPHRVTLNGKSAFYLRAQRHVTEFSYPQLREAFNLRTLAEDRVRAFRADRLARIKSGRTPRRLKAGAQYAIHILPLVSFAQSTKVELSRLSTENRHLLYGRLSSLSCYHNLDGLVWASHLDAEHDHKYVQAFRNGAIESVGFAGALIDNRKILPSTLLAEEFRAALAAQLPVLLSLGVSGPIAVAVTWLSVGDYEFPTTNYHSTRADRDDLEVPEVWADSIDAVTADIDTVARPLLDTLWQCFDVYRCPLYDEQGNWIAR
ncbi:RNA-binding domain-containing protein [Cupriavidus taiwanensis]